MLNEQEKNTLALPVVVHVKSKDFDVYIGRAMPGFPASIWANPFAISVTCTREQALEKYQVHLDAMLQKEENRSALFQLMGKRIGCWCKPRACHGDLLVNALRRELRLEDPVDPNPTPEQGCLFE